MQLLPDKSFSAATRRWLGPFARSGRIVKITVRDERFQVIRVLSADNELAAFRDLWSKLIEVNPPDTTGAGGALQAISNGYAATAPTRVSRWYYFPGGAIRLLAILRTIWAAPLYPTPTPDAFEALLRP